MKKFYNLLFKNKNKLKYYIDIISSNNISGWVYQEGITFSEIRLLIGNNLIANSKIEVLREDVNQSLKVNNDLALGFSLDLKYNEEFKKYSGKPRLLVSQNDGSNSIDILKSKKFQIYKKKLESYIKDEILGLSGFIHGIQDNSVVGWAFRNQDSDPVEIWMHCNFEYPINILCNSEISHGAVRKKIGFSFNLRDFPNNWINQKVKFTFDKKGLYRVPGNNELILALEYLNIKDRGKASFEKNKINTVLFAGYPKSGNTLIGQAINLAGNVETVFDYYTLNKNGITPALNPIFKEEVCSIKTHNQWDPKLNIHDLYFGKVLKVIVINRNPFDTLLSGINFFRVTYKNTGLNAFQKRSLRKLFPGFKVDDDFLDKFNLENLKQKGWLDKALNRFSEDGTSFLNFYAMSGTWSGFASSYEYSGLPILKVRYEDLEEISIDSFNGKGNTNPYLLEISSFLDVDPENLARGFALQRSNALKEKENTQINVKFMNKMTSGYWRNYFTLKTCRTFVRKNYHAMLINGYEELVQEIL